MTDQRLRLQKYLNQQQRFRATFSEIRHDKHNQPFVLLLDVYPITNSGRKIPLRSKPALYNKHHLQIACDHVWCPLPASLLTTNFEILYGDILDFTATVTAYPITRDNVLELKHDFYQSGSLKSKQIYQNYQISKQQLYDQFKLTNQKIYESYQNQLLTFTEMKKAQLKLNRRFHTLQNKSYAKMQQQQHHALAKFQQKIEHVQKIDYALTDLTKIQLHHRNHRADLFRQTYNPHRFADLKYTKYLAYHSMAVRDRLT